jgi:hypothetical protein
VSARTVEVEVHAAAGSGAFALAVSEAPLSVIVPAGADETLGAELQQVIREARDLGYRPHSQLGVGPRHLSLLAAEPQVIKLGADSAHCLRAYLISHRPGARAQLSAAGKQLDVSESDGQPARFCAGSDQASLPDPIELRLTSPEDAGDAWLLVLVR